MSDKLEPYRGKVGLDLMDALGRDARLRPMLVDGVCYLSLVNLMEVFGDSNISPRMAWRDEKRRLQKRKPELWESFSQLKLTALDGKERLTDVAPLETCFRVLMYMNTPSSDAIKDLAAGVLARVSEAALRYRAMNIANGREWAADEIHAELYGNGDQPDDSDDYTSASEELGYV